MEWMDDKDGRRASIERAWALARLDGLTRYVVCLEGWPIWTDRPEGRSGEREFARVARDGHVSYERVGE